MTDIQSILDEVDELKDIPVGVTITSSTEPTQKDWEEEWVNLGYDLPVTVGAELYWDDGDGLRGMYMTVEDVFTLPTRWSKLLDTYEDTIAGVNEVQALRNIWVRWWGDDNYLIGTGTYDGVEGTYKIYLDGTVELLTSYVAVAIHSKALTMVVNDTGTLKLFDIATLSLGATINVVTWSAELTGAVSEITTAETVTLPSARVSSGWGFTDRISWYDPQDENNLDLYFVDSNDVYFYEDGVGSSLLFSVTPTSTHISTICYQNSRLALSYEVGFSGNFVGEVYDLAGDLITSLGGTSLSTAGGANITPADYPCWHFRKNVDDNTVIDVLYSVDPKVPGKSKRYVGFDLDQFGNHSWKRYTQYNTTDDFYSGGFIYDERLEALEEDYGSLTIHDDNDVLDVELADSDSHRWGASLFGGREQSYTFIISSPSGEKLLLGWGGVFGMKYRGQDYLIQAITNGNLGGGKTRPVLESGRHGSIVLSLSGTEKSTGKVYKISEYTERLPTEVLVTKYTVDYDRISFDINISDVPDGYDILKISAAVRRDDATLTEDFVALTFNGDSVAANYYSNWFRSQSTAESSQDNVGKTGIIFPVVGQYSVLDITIYDFRAGGKYPTVLAHHGRDSTTFPREGMNVGVWKNTGGVGTITFTKNTNVFMEGAEIVVTALRTEGKYSLGGGQNDYRMA